MRECVRSESIEEEMYKERGVGSGRGGEEKGRCKSGVEWGRERVEGLKGGEEKGI